MTYERSLIFDADYRYSSWIIHSAILSLVVEGKMERTKNIKYRKTGDTNKIFGSRVKHIKLADHDSPMYQPFKHLVTSIWLTQGEKHDILEVYNRGALAGKLTVNAGDGIMLMSRLFGPNVIEVFDEEG